MTTRVFIDGAAGTTGLEIADRLEGRADLELIRLPDERRKNAGARRDALNAADVAILCLPDAAAREAVALLDPAGGARAIDASTAHRTDPAWTYGFPELVGRERVAAARRVSNPGCYPTGFLALVAPLVRAGLLPAGAALGVHAVSGYSGGGKAMIAEFEAPDAPQRPAYRAYALGLGHKHVAEMQEHAGLLHPPLFTPAVVATFRGMLVEVPLDLGDRAPPLDEVRDALRAAYAGSALVSLPKVDGDLLAVERCAGTDRLELFAFGDPATRQLRLIAALDNLGKGAAGAAVQSLNLMAGLEETAGLRL